MRCLEWEKRLNQYVNDLVRNPPVIDDSGSYSEQLVITWSMLCYDHRDIDNISHSQIMSDPGLSLIKKLYKLFGKPVHGARGQRGDIAYFDKQCGIVVGRNAVFFNESGYLLIPMIRIKWVFKVR